ncbi:MAG: acetoin utilization protein AcuC [Acidocella sp. 20-57-95]|nr:MAG: acetoin utilization protein AcuC [Acidocella sp. 20-57-95]HQT63472.1 acetoin utilization protein AcuC [Acidocella sp.]HQU05395.1 acetoin utilization protein AcuC [Acidocella sp.]
MSICFIGSEIYRLPVFQPPHPLAVPRAMLAHDLCRALGWLADSQYIEATAATLAELARFHATDYLVALQTAEAQQSLPPDVSARTRIGKDANEIHPAVFRRPAISAGSALQAASLVAAGGAVYAPGAGNHHGMPDRANGFCFVNDIALAILRWRDLGIRRIAYLDLDAHHGDGVEAAFASDADILTISVHEAGRWPRTGTASVPANSIWNFPVPPGFNDTELRALMTSKVLPVLRNFAPDALIFLPGADALQDDPMSRLALSNNAIWEALAAVRGLAPRLAVLGGGGYNPFTLARCWAGIWAILNDIPVPEALPQAAQSVLRGAAYFRSAGRNPPPHWFEQLRDAPAEGAVRDEVKGFWA